MPVINSHHEALQDLMAVCQETAQHLELLHQMGLTVVEALKAGNQILTCGNGGSATDAAHMAEELTGRYKANRVALPAVSLASDGAALTCIGNDFGFDQIFSRQVEALGKTGDVLVGFSTSGNSPNVNNAFGVARERGIRTIGFSGKTGGMMKELTEQLLIVPSESTARIQELHTFFLHCILQQVEDEFCE